SQVFPCLFPHNLRVRGGRLHSILRVLAWLLLHPHCEPYPNYHQHFLSCLGCSHPGTAREYSLCGRLVTMIFVWIVHSQASNTIAIGLRK
ncbi:hypothetical protein R3P38DRAFT_2826514, partial [Favolaschia claudopus]